MPLVDITEGSSLSIVYGQNVVMRNSCEREGGREGETMEENSGAVMVILPPPPPQICLNNHSCAAARAIPDAPAAQYSARL